MSRDLTDALDRLTKAAQQSERQRPPLRGEASKAVSAAQPTAGTAGGGGGISAAYTEASAASRTYWPAGWQTTDGIFTLPAIKSVQMTDASGNPTLFSYAEPGS